MKWVNNLQQIARYSLSRNYVLKGNNTVGISKETRRSILGLFEFNWGGFEFDGKSQMPKHDGTMLEARRFRHSNARKEPDLDRNFLAGLWVLDKKLARELERRKIAHIRYRNYMKENGSVGHAFKQPPLSQPTTGYLAPTSPEESQVAPLLARSNLLITRHIEWANLVFGFEQENRYAIVDVCYPHSPVGFIREQSNVLLRQFLRLRRPFVAYITDALGNELFRIRRPFWWITSSIYAEVNGKEIGVVHQRWHLWRRIYDLYLGNKQFAVVENPGFWNWTFTMKDNQGNVLAEIDRDWRGFGLEVFTDAGQYVIRFGSADSALKTGPAGVVENLEIERPLTLSERAVALSLAVSLDNDFFSRHGGSWFLGIPFIFTE